MLLKAEIILADTFSPVSRRPPPIVAYSAAYHGTQPDHFGDSTSGVTAGMVEEAELQRKEAMQAVDLDSLTVDDLDFELGLQEAVLANGKFSADNFTR